MSAAENPGRYGIALAEEWENQVDSITDSVHDMANDLRDGRIQEGDLPLVREAFVARMRELFNEVANDAVKEVTGT